MGEVLMMFVITKLENPPTKIKSFIKTVCTSTSTYRVLPPLSLVCILQLVRNRNSQKHVEPQVYFKSQISTSLRRLLKKEINCCCLIANLCHTQKINREGWGIICPETHLTGGGGT